MKTHPTLLTLISLIGIAWCLTAGAATYTVTKTADTADGTCDADCSLREAVIAANANAGLDSIEIPIGTYTLTRSGDDNTASQGDLDLLQDTEISGSGATIIDGNQLDAVFHIASGISVTFNQVTITKGKSFYINFAGGIFNEGNLALRKSIIRENTAQFGGGGIYCSGGNVEILDSAILNNAVIGSGGSGGGFYGDNCPLVVTNSTFSGNSATASGGGIANSKPTKLANVTLSDNVADSDGNDVGDGGGIFMATAQMMAKNTLIAGNHDLSPGSDVFPDCSTNTLPVSDGYNLIGVGDNCSGGGTAFSTANHDLIGSFAIPLVPRLTLLSLRGGITPVHSFLSGSPALDAGNPAGCTDYNSTALATDQRGFDRTVGARCDIGAFEQGDCGDGVKDPGEACDDGNASNTDACTNACDLADCGDGFVQAGVEGCDDGNTNDGDGCSASCALEAAGTTGGGTTTGSDTGGETTGGTAGEASSGGCSLIR